MSCHCPVPSSQEGPPLQGAQKKQNSQTKGSDFAEQKPSIWSSYTVPFWGQPHHKEYELCQEVCSAWFDVQLAGISGHAGVPGEYVHCSSTLGQVFVRQKHVNFIPSEYSSDISYQSVFWVSCLKAIQLGNRNNSRRFKLSVTQCEC